jgi:IS5 family transposase
LLQQWYGLSDPGLEEALVDRLLFRRFLGLSLSDPVPDHSTVWCFREQVAKSGLAERAFALITRQIERSGFVLKRGTLIDASLVRSSVNPPEPTSVPPLPDADGRARSKLVRNALDPDAAWTRKDDKYFFGYKAHVAIDQGSRIVRQATFTPANTNETVPADELICSDEQTVYADKVYDNKARCERLKRLGIRDGIARRGNRWHQMPRWMVRRNELISRVRAPGRAAVRAAQEYLSRPSSRPRPQRRSLLSRACRHEPQAVGCSASGLSERGRAHKPDSILVCRRPPPLRDCQTLQSSRGRRYRAPTARLARSST